MRLSRRISRLEQRIIPERRLRFLVLYVDSESRRMSQAEMAQYTRIWVVKTVGPRSASRVGDEHLRCEF